MKRLFHILSKINFSFSTIITLSLSVIVGRFKVLFIHLFISFIHEIGHVLAAVLLKKEVRQIQILPFGMNAEIMGLEYSKPLHEFLILIAGPMTFFITQIIVKYCYILDVMSYHSYLQAQDANRMILIFNLLPIWPLDGIKIIKCLLQYICPIKKLNYVILTISFISLICFISYMWHDPQIIIILFLILSQIRFVTTINIRHWKMLIHRYINKMNLPVKIHSKKDLFWPFDNYYMKDKVLYDEKQFILELMKKH